MEHIREGRAQAKKVSITPYVMFHHRFFDIDIVNIISLTLA